MTDIVYFLDEKKLLLEDDSVILGRINSLMSFFQNNNTPEVSQMILNSLETYKKLIICETELQNKIGCSTLENLIKALLVITCHRKEYDHLNSMVSFALSPAVFALTNIVLSFRSKSSHITVKFSSSSTKSTQ